MSGINDALVLGGASAPNSWNAAYAMTRTYGLCCAQLPLLLLVVDCARAYKHVGIGPAKEFLPYTTLTDEEGNLFCAELKTQSFGSRCAPCNWARVAGILEFAIMRYSKFGYASTSTTVLQWGQNKLRTTRWEPSSNLPKSSASNSLQIRK